MSEPNRIRKVQLNFRVTEREKMLIEEKMQELGTTNRKAYLRKLSLYKRPKSICWWTSRHNFVPEKALDMNDGQSVSISNIWLRH